MKYISVDRYDLNKDMILIIDVDIIAAKNEEQQEETHRTDLSIM